jgi:hypothetical protein
MSNKIIGWQEWCGLPNLNIQAIKAKIDTGATTSCLDAFNIQPIKVNGIDYVNFRIHPIQNRQNIIIECNAPLIDQRTVSNSGGQRQLRYVIETEIVIAGESWNIEVTLTNRKTMKFRMLLGRQALENRYIVDTSRSFIYGRLNGAQIKQYYL